MCACRCRAATTSAPARSTCTRRPRGDGRDVQVQPTATSRRHADRLHGADITFEFPSVGATENILTAAVYAEGTTTIDNAAREPEIADLCDLLVAWAPTSRASARRRSSSTASSAGRCTPADHRPSPDRIQAATYLAAVAVAGGEIVDRRAPARAHGDLLARFAEMGLEITADDGLLGVAADGRLRSIDVADAAVSRASPPTTSR